MPSSSPADDEPQPNAMHAQHRYKVVTNVTATFLG